MRRQYMASLGTLLVALAAVSSCTLKKRTDPNAKPPGPGIEQTPPGANTDNGQDVPYSGTPGKIDPKIQFDYDEYNNPSLSEDDEFEEGGDPSLKGKKRFTGSMNDSGYYYTDASTDFLMPYLRTVHNESKDSHRQKSSVNFAKKIRDVRLLNLSGGQIGVSIRYEVGSNRTATVKLTGPLKMGGRYALLSEKSALSRKQLGEENWALPVNDPLGEPSSTPSPTPTPTELPFNPPPKKGKGPIQQQPEKAPKQAPEKKPKSPKKPHRSSGDNAGMVGELRCVDLSHSPKCSHYFLRIIMKTRDVDAIAEVIIRRTPATLRITQARSNTMDPRVQILREFLSNSTLRNPQGPHITTFDVQSFAVVNGRSEFQVRLNTNMGEKLYFSGPLLAALGDQPINVLLKRNPNATESANAKWLSNRAGQVTSLIDSARLVYNNGRGSLRIELIVADHHTQEPVAFGLTFTRVLVPILDLTQDSIYFNP